MATVLKITYELAEKNKGTMIDLYYQNAIACSYMKNFSIESAENKIDSLISHLKDGSAICFGLFDNSKVKGFIWAYSIFFREEQRIYISEIRIIDEYRGEGYGSQLLRAVENEARVLGINAVYLHAEANNENAISFYKHNDYQIERVQMRKEII